MYRYLVFLCFLSHILCYGNVCLSGIKGYQSWIEVPEHDLKSLVERIQSAFQQHPSFQGYVVQFGRTPIEGVVLIPRGGTRSQKQLSGTPEDVLSYAKNSCPFCAYVRNTFQDKHITEIFKDAYAATSLSGQLLVIPNQHFSHWFDTPLDTQITLLKHTFSLREKYPSNRPIVLHCGSSAGQTVFHLHVRTGILQ